MNHEPSTKTSDTEPDGRRRFLRASTIGAAGVAAGAAIGGLAGAANASNDNRRRLVVEAAMRGETERAIPSEAIQLVFPDVEISAGDIRGTAFWIEGWLYPEGTIPSGDGFVPTDNDSIGVITCRGHLIVSPERGEPHLVTHQEYHFGSFTEGILGANLMSSQGFEGRNGNGWQSLRIVNGGTGQYRGARGEVLQTMTGFNATANFNGVPSPSFRFEFDVDVL